MPVSLFGREGGSDPATRALSVTDVQPAFVEGVYNKIAAVDDWIFGVTLHAGRMQAIRKLDLQPGDEILEVGVGTGINATLYPRHVTVTGIDIVQKMLEKAKRRLGRRKVENVRLLHMDAMALEFPDDSFDLVYAPVRHERRARSGGGGARDAARLPSRRPVRLPQPFPELDPARGASRAVDLAADDPHRLQVRTSI